mmetsp:Transcript_99826/g.278839  ORF Transcript_99826/g.278839 Transcript_99826/m.278839 type:complete len:493 (+) Transcript_99826:159-1637(+)
MKIFALLCLFSECTFAGSSAPLLSLSVLACPRAAGPFRNAIIAHGGSFESTIFLASPGSTQIGETKCLALSGPSAIRAATLCSATSSCALWKNSVMRVCVAAFTQTRPNTLLRVRQPANALFCLRCWPLLLRGACSPCMWSCMIAWPNLLSLVAPSPTPPRDPAACWQNSANSSASSTIRPGTLSSSRDTREASSNFWSRGPRASASTSVSAALCESRLSTAPMAAGDRVSPSRKSRPARPPRGCQCQAFTAWTQDWTPLHRSSSPRPDETSALNSACSDSSSVELAGSRSSNIRCNSPASMARFFRSSFRRQMSTSLSMPLLPGSSESAAAEEAVVCRGQTADRSFHILLTRNSWRAVGCSVQSRTSHTSSERHSLVRHSRAAAAASATSFSRRSSSAGPSSLPANPASRRQPTSSWEPRRRSARACVQLYAFSEEGPGAAAGATSGGSGARLAAAAAAALPTSSTHLRRGTSPCPAALVATIAEMHMALS